MCNVAMMLCLYVCSPRRYMTSSPVPSQLWFIRSIFQKFLDIDCRNNKILYKCIINYIKYPQLALLVYL